MSLNKKEAYKEFKETFLNDFKNAPVFKDSPFTGRISFSSHITFTFSAKDEITMLLKKEAPLKNMQEDGSAFESYALAFISLYETIGRKIKIVLDIEEPIDENYANSYVNNTNVGHFNRFLYRLIKFNQQFGKYIKLSNNFGFCINKLYFNRKKNDKTRIYQSYQAFITSKKSMSAFGNEAKVSAKLATNFSKFSEAQTEEYFFKHPKALKKATGIEKLNRQFPVGVFFDSVTTQNTIFVGQKAAIDLWGINKKKNSFCLFELKKLGVKQIGILSELFFYSNLIKDIYCDNNNYTREKNNSNKEARGSKCINELQGNIDEVHAYFLTSTMHPLITSNTIALLNTGSSKIKYYSIKFDDKLKIQTKKKRQSI